MSNPRQLLQILQKAGFKGEGLRSAYAVAMKESSGRPDAFNPNEKTQDLSYGLFQINMRNELGPSRRKQFELGSNEELFDPLRNAQIAYRMSKGGTDFGAWGIGPNAYRRDPNITAAFQKYFNQFPNIAKQAGINTSANLRLASGPVDASALAGYHTRSAVLNAEQDKQAQQQQFYHDSILRMNELLADSASPSTVTALQRLGGTAAMIAERLDRNPIQLHVPKAPEIEARANAYGGTTVTPVDPSSPSGVYGIGDKNVPKAIQQGLIIAQQQIGTPYVWGGASPEGGFDCSGLIEYALEKAGVKTPGRLTTWTIKNYGKSVKGQDLLPGDMILTGGGGHVVWYVGGGKVIAAPRRGEVVQYQDVSRFEGKIEDVRRITPARPNK